MMLVEEGNNNMPNRYMLFAGHDQSPHGGMGDLKGIFISVERASQHIIREKFNWYHIYDTVLGITDYGPDRGNPDKLLLWAARIDATSGR
jgi:hypothetical protein